MIPTKKRMETEAARNLLSRAASETAAMTTAAGGMVLASLQVAESARAEAAAATGSMSDPAHAVADDAAAAERPTNSADEAAVPVAEPEGTSVVPVQAAVDDVQTVAPVVVAVGSGATPPKESQALSTEAPSPEPEPATDVGPASADSGGQARVSSEPPQEGGSLPSTGVAEAVFPMPAPGLTNDLGRQVTGDEITNVVTGTSGLANAVLDSVFAQVPSASELVAATPVVGGLGTGLTDLPSDISRSVDASLGSLGLGDADTANADPDVSNLVATTLGSLGLGDEATGFVAGESAVGTLASETSLLSGGIAEGVDATLSSLGLGDEAASSRSEAGLASPVPVVDEVAGGSSTLSSGGLQSVTGTLTSFSLGQEPSVLSSPDLFGFIEQSAAEAKPATGLDGLASLPVELLGGTEDEEAAIWGEPITLPAADPVSIADGSGMDGGIVDLGFLGQSYLDDAGAHDLGGLAMSPGLSGLI